MDKYSNHSLRRAKGPRAQGSFKDEGMNHVLSKPPRPREVLAESERNLQCKVEGDNAYHLFMSHLSIEAVEALVHLTNNALSSFSQKTRPVTVLEMLFRDRVNLF